MAKGEVYVFIHRVDAAEVEFSRAVEIRRAVLGDEHPDTLGAMRILAVTLWHRGKFDEAEAVERDILEARRRVLGEEHRDTVTSMSNLAFTLRRRGKLDEAEAMYRDIVEIRRRVLGKNHRDTLSAMGSLAARLQDRGKLDEAESLRKEVVEIRQGKLGEDHGDTLSAMNRLALVLEEKGDVNEAEALRRKILEIRQDKLGEEHPSTLWAMNRLAVVLWRSGKLDKAVEMNRRILEIRRLVEGEEHPETVWAKSNLAVLLEEKERLERKAAISEVPPETEGRILAFDDFDGKLGLDWQILHPDPSHFSLTKKAGALTITTQDGGFTRSDTGYKNLFLIDCPARAGQDFQLTTCLSSFSPMDDWNQAGLICYDDDDNYLKFVYEWNTGPGGREFNVGIETEGSFSHTFFGPRYEWEQVWLRVTKRGNRYTVSTSLDGETFSPMKYLIDDPAGLFQRDVLWGDGSVRQVGLFAHNSQVTAAPELDASFDFFEVRAISDTGERREKGISAHRKEMNVETR